MEEKDFLHRTEALLGSENLAVLQQSFVSLDLLSMKLTVGGYS